MRPASRLGLQLEALAQRRRGGAYLMVAAALVAARVVGAVWFPWRPALLLLVLGASSALALGALLRAGRLRLVGPAAAAVWVPLDLAVVTALVAISGGATSPLWVLYAAVLLPAAFAAGTAGVAMASAAVAAAYAGALPLLAGRLDTAPAALGRIALLLAALLPAQRGIVELRRKRQRVAALRRSERDRALELEALSAELEARNRELDRLNRELERAAVTDSLTGLPNRRYLLQTVRTAIGRVRRRRAEGSANRDLGVLMVDLDRFKRINDLFGHEAGDAVLREAAQRIRRAVREADIVVRWGGEEFLVLAPEVDRARLGELADRIRERVAATAAHTSRGGAVPTTCSVGYAAWPLDAEERLSWEDAVALADAALRIAKAEGRNRCVGLDLARPDLPHDAASRALRDPEAALAAGVLTRVG